MKYIVFILTSIPRPVNINAY